MTAPDLLPAFPHAIPLHVNGGDTYQDDTFNPGCGYISPHEAAILYTAAIDFPGVWIEIGSHTGWSAAHIAAAGNVVHAVEPQYVNPSFYARAAGNWRRARLAYRIMPWATTSEDALKDGHIPQPRFDGAFIDGDHEPPQPLLDAQMVLPRMEDRCVIVLHDHIGTSVKHAVSWLAGQGLNVRVYETPQQLAVCWRGAWEPPETA